MKDTIGSDFMEYTKYPHLSPSLQSQGVPPPALEVPAPAGARLIELPPAANLPEIPVNLLGLIEKRETLRQYTEEPLTLVELTTLLWGTQGVRHVDQVHKVIRQNVPSEGRGTPLRPGCWSTVWRGWNRGCTATWASRTSWRSFHSMAISTMR